MLVIFRRIKGLYDRYVFANSGVAGATGRIRTASGQSVGEVTSLDRDQMRVRVAGSISAKSVKLVCGAHSVLASRPPGMDVSIPLSFDMVVPTDGNARPELRWSTYAAEQTKPLLFPGPLRRQIADITSFAWSCIKLVPAFWGWRRTHDPKYRGIVKRGLGLDRDGDAHPLVRQCLPLETPSLANNSPQPAEITIILPVHNGFDVLNLCLQRVAKNTDLPWHLIAIDDASTDSRIRPHLETFATQIGTDDAVNGRLTLLYSDTNLGFIGAVNKGLETAGITPGHAPGVPVILLNTDAFVPARWASRLTAPLADPTVASVTPMSNDAEITTAPVICQRTPLAIGAADHLDAIAQQLTTEWATADMPTGVGFCMALSPIFLAQIPRIDTAFGRGYGEEVDWCQKARTLGGRHVGLGSLFVEHRGGASFGSAAKARLIAQNGALISQRYPSYDLDVARFIATDPLATPRLALALAWAGITREDVPVYLAHDMGGGAEHWLKQRIQIDASNGLASVVLRVGGSFRWQLEVHAQDRTTEKPATTAVGTMDIDAIAWLLSLLPSRILIYSCGVGDPDPATLPDTLLSLLSSNDRLEVLFHDWFPISPSYTLLDDDGVYRGPVTAARTNSAHQTRRADGKPVSLMDWQESWGRLLERAEKIRVFSADGLTQVTTTWPHITPDRIHVASHDISNLTSLAASPKPLNNSSIVIGVLGNLNEHKGVKVVADLSRKLYKCKSSAKIVVIGNVDPAHPLPTHVQVHGAYSVPEIPNLIATYGISHWLIPSIWPETFSYTTQEALATGLPVYAFDLGAQGAAVEAAQNGQTLHFSPDTDPSTSIFKVIETLTAVASH